MDIVELYDPAVGDFSVIGKTDPRSTDLYSSGVILLNNGKVLVAGGRMFTTKPPGPRSAAEIFDPATATFSRTGDMLTEHIAPTATLLPDGRVLVAGGVRTPVVELYDPVTGAWRATFELPEARQQHTATLLPTGEVLIIGGTVLGSDNLSSAVIYVP